jgi:hypothetical protein
MRLRGQEGDRRIPLKGLPASFGDGFAYLAAVVAGTEKVSDIDRSSLSNNLIVACILEAAQRSARTRRTISLER